MFIFCNDNKYITHSDKTTNHRQTSQGSSSSTLRLKLFSIGWSNETCYYINICSDSSWFYFLKSGWKLTTTMAEFEQNRLNSLCEQTKNISNWSDTKIAIEMLKPTLTTNFIVKAFIPVAFIIGFVGNVAFFLLIARVKTMRTTTNFYLANLAAADLLYLSLETLNQLWRYISFKYVYSEPYHTNFGCFISYFTIHLASLSSIMLITLVSFDRYLAICYPIKYRITKNKKQTSYILTLLIWIISAILCILRSLADARLEYECILWPHREKYQYFSDTVRHCKPIHPFFHTETLEHVVHSVPFIAALVINFSVNIRIIQRLRKPPPGENGSQQNEQIKRRITWMLLANSVIFFCSLAPFHFFLVSKRLLNYYFRTVFVFAMLNSAINPILYFVACPSYRRGYLRAFGIKSRKWSIKKLREHQLSLPLNPTEIQCIKLDFKNTKEFIMQRGKQNSRACQHEDLKQLARYNVERL